MEEIIYELSKLGKGVVGKKSSRNKVSLERTQKRMDLGKNTVNDLENKRRRKKKSKRNKNKDTLIKGLRELLNTESGQ